jgi:hypothetical protein
MQQILQHHENGLFYGNVIRSSIGLHNNRPFARFAISLGYNESKFPRNQNQNFNKEEEDDEMRAFA